MRTLPAVLAIMLSVSVLPTAVADGTPTIRERISCISKTVSARYRLTRGIATRDLSGPAYGIFDRIYQDNTYQPTPTEKELLTKEGVDILLEKYRSAGKFVKELNRKWGILSRSNPQPQRRGWRRLLDSWKIFIPILPSPTKFRTERIFEKVLKDRNYKPSPREVAFLKKWDLTDKLEAFRSDLEIHGGPYAKLTKIRKVGDYFKWSTILSVAGLALMGNTQITADQSYDEDDPEGMSRYDEKVELIYFSPAAHASIRIGGLVYNYGVLQVDRMPLEKFRAMVGFGEAISGSHTRIELKLTEDERYELQQYLEGDVGKVYPLIIPFNDCVSQTNKAVQQVCELNVPPVLDRSQVGSVMYYKLQKFLGSDRIGKIHFASKGGETVMENAKSTAVNVLDAYLFARFAKYVVVVGPLLDLGSSTYEWNPEDPQSEDASGQ